MRWQEALALTLMWLFGYVTGHAIGGLRAKAERLQQDMQKVVDQTRRPPPLSPEERKKRADQRDRGVLNDGGEIGTWTEQFDGCQDVS